MRNKTMWMACAALIVCAGCASSGPVTSPFTRGKTNMDRIPAEAVRAAAALIEREVRDGNREPALGGIEGIVIDTPEIRQAVRERAARSQLVRDFLDSGHAWERPNGRLWIIRSEDYKKAASARRRDLDAIMVNGENRNRWAIYEGILEANDLPQSGLSAIEQIFFEARKALMTTGQKYEDENGQPAQIP